METLIQFDQDSFLVVNGLHLPWLDEVMFWVSKKYVWIPVYALLFVGLVRMLGWRQALVAGGMVGLLILMADQTASGLLKPWIERPRPCHDPLLAGQVHLVHGKCGGPYGFASSHSANFFALATYLSFFFRRNGRFLPIVFVATAALVAYSRVYLGVHYPGDVVVGALIGVVSGLVVWGLYSRFLSRLWSKG